MNRAAIAIPEKLFFKIGEVCELTGVQAHVLRYWESEFPMLAPQKNRAGQRTYRKRDVEMALRIKELLYDDQYTIAGAKKKLAAELRGASKLKVVTPEMAPPTALAPVAEVGRQDSVAALPVTEEFSGSNRTSPAEVASQMPESRRSAMVEIARQLRELLNMLESSSAGHHPHPK